MIDRDKFFGSVRAYFGNLSQSQVDGFNNILDEWERRRWFRLTWLAYMLATCWWETANTMQPIREMGSEAYLRAKPYYPWVGEGLVQVTWEANARKFGATQPGDLLTWPIALVALFEGMSKGMFTGHKLPDYFSDNLTDPVDARRIINGLDKASTIAGFYWQFMKAIGG